MAGSEELSAELVAALRQRLSDRGPMTVATLAEELGEDPDTLFDAVDDVMDDSVTALLDGRWAHVPTLLQGRIFTHRLAADEVRHDLLAEDPDLEPLLFLPESDHRISTGEPLPSLLPGLDRHPDRRPVPPEAVSPGGSLLLPAGTLRAAGADAGDLVGLRVTPAGLELRRVDPADLGDPQPAQDAIAGVLLPDQPSDLGPTLLTACADALDVFRRPVLPLTELVARAGLSRQGDFLAPAGFDIVAHHIETRRADLAETYELSEDEALATLALLRRYEDLLSESLGAGRPTADPEREAAIDIAVSEALPLLAEPAVADALARETLRYEVESATVVERMVDSLWDQAGRPVRSALEWLRAKARERGEDIAGAEESLRAAERLDPDWPLTLLDLARYASDRGDTVHGLALLRRAEPWEDPDLQDLLERFLPVAGPVVGRNNPCWCGSGRKFKQCHLHQPAEHPLSDRAYWLYAKAARFVQEGPWLPLLEIVAEERAAYAEDEEDVRTAVTDPLVGDAVLFEGGGFAEFLEVRGHLLPADERLLAEQWLLVDRSVFEVTAVRRDEGISVRDVRTGDAFHVQERLGSRGLRSGQLICARVMPTGEVMQIFGGIEPVRLHERDDLLALLDSEPTPEDLVRFLTGRFAPPVVVDRDGEPIDLEEMLAAAHDVESADPVAPLDPDLVRELMTTHMADYERRWLDMSVPALHGLTPRQAAADPTRREDLVQLLATFPDTDAPTEMSAGRLRAALGLTT